MGWSVLQVGGQVATVGGRWQAGRQVGWQMGGQMGGQPGRKEGGHKACSWPSHLFVATMRAPT